MRMVLQFIVFFAAGLFLLSTKAVSQAQTGSNAIILPTWRAESYAPQDFFGKILPAKGSRVTMSFDVVENGKVLEISGKTVYWHFNNKLITTGRGIQSVTMRAPTGNMSIRIEVADISSGSVFSSFVVPVVSPEAVIERRSPYQAFSSRSFEVRALPYFFNVNDSSLLVFDWKINGVAPTSAQNPTSLTVGVGDGEVKQGSSVAVRLIVRNPVDIYESASRTNTFVFSGP